MLYSLDGQCCPSCTVFFEWAGEVSAPNRIIHALKTEICRAVCLR